MLGPFERLAPISYGLYIVHKPIVQIAAQRAPLGNIWLELVWVIPVVLGLSWVSERWIHRYVLRLLRGALGGGDGRVAGCVPVTAASGGRDGCRGR